MGEIDMRQFTPADEEENDFSKGYDEGAGDAFESIREMLAEEIERLKWQVNVVAGNELIMVMAQIGILEVQREKLYSKMSSF